MIHATLQQLRLFDAVARHKSITRAAEDVHLTQPAVSIQIKRLEEKIGMPLLEHIGKAMHLTTAGEEVFAACQDILERMSALESDLDDLRDEVAGPLNVTVVSSAKYFLPHLLGNFVKRYPKVEPRLQITNREKLLNAITANEGDLFIMGQPPADLPVNEHPVLENVLVFVAKPDHPLVGQKNIPLERLMDERIVGREPGSGTRKAVENIFADANLKIAPYIELSSAEAIKQGVLGGLGLAVLSLHSLHLELDAGVLAMLDVQGFPLRRRWFAAHRDGKHLSRAARTFLSYLQEEGEDEVSHLIKNVAIT